MARGDAGELPENMQMLAAVVEAEEPDAFHVSSGGNKGLAKAKKRSGAFLNAAKYHFPIIVGRYSRRQDRAAETVSKPHFIVAADVSRLIIPGISFEIGADSRPLLQF